MYSCTSKVDVTLTSKQKCTDSHCILIIIIIIIFNISIALFTIKDQKRFT